MKAIGVLDPGRGAARGAVQLLEVLDLPDPAGPVPKGWVRIRVRAAAVNPGDLAFCRGARTLMQRGTGLPPYVPGMEAAGTLAAIGAETATDLRPGDDVMTILHPVPTIGAYCESVVVPIASVARMPAGVSYAEACTLPLNGLAARQALDLLGLWPGDTLVVTGAAGAVGGYAVQLAKLEGLRVIADASPPDRDLVAKLGADIVLPRGPGFAECVRRVMTGGADGAVDAASLNEALTPAVRDGGGVATLCGFPGTGERGIRHYSVFVSRYARDPAKLDRLRGQVEAGHLRLRVAGVLPAEEAACAHRLLVRGGVRGRIVLEF